MSTNLIQTFSFTKAAEFVEALRPTYSLWQPNPWDWVFRGHADASWKLLPTIHRRVTLGKFTRGVGELAGDEIYCDINVGHVRRLLEHFAGALNSAGFDVPGGTALNKAYKKSLPKPADELFEDLAALGQHHGLPTRLLDWTRVGSYAAYFAASEFASISTAPGLMEVWALSVKVAGKKELGVSGDRKAKVRIVTPPRAGNANLHAQSGVFSLVLTPGGTLDESSPLYRLPVDEVVPAIAAANRISEPMMYRLTLPGREASEVIRWLTYDRVTGATMFPGHDGVVRYVRDGLSWRKD